MCLQILITACTTLIFYLVIGYSIPDSTATGIMGPLIMTAILAYFVACMFCEIFGMCIETILLCFIADEELFDPEKRFAEGSLKSAIPAHTEAKQDGAAAGQMM